LQFVDMKAHVKGDKKEKKKKRKKKKRKKEKKKNRKKEKRDFDFRSSTEHLAFRGMHHNIRFKKDQNVQASK
jgi:hypothetical protein